MYRYICIYIYVFWEGEGSRQKSDKKITHEGESMQSKKLCRSSKCFYVPFSVTQSFLLGFPCSSNNITVRNEKKNIQDPMSVSKIGI